MTIATRLTLLLAVPLVILAGLGLFIVYQLNNIEKKGRFVAVTQIESLAELGKISSSLTEMRVSARTYFLTEDEEEQLQASVSMRHNAAELTRQLAHYGDRLISDDRDLRLFIEFRDLSREWLSEAEKIVSLSVARHRNEGRALLLTGSFPLLGVRLGNALSEWIKHNQKLAGDAGMATVTAIAESERKLLAAIAVAMLLSGTLGLLTFRRIVHPIRNLQTSVESIAAGDYVRAVPSTREAGEIGGLARSIDILKQGAAAMDEKRWIKANVAALTGAVQGSASLSDFGQRVLAKLMPLLGGGIAGVYVWEKDPGRLRRLASYGISDIAGAQEYFSLGEGLVGECARQRGSTVLTNLPPDYLRIASGSGGAAPVQAVCYPLMSDDDLVGVIEFGSFRAFSGREIALLEELLPVVAMSLQVLSHSIATEELLVRTREQAQQLEEQATALTVGARLDCMHSEIGAALVRSEACDVTMRQCAEAVKRGVNAEFTGIWMLEPDAETLVLRTSVGLCTQADGEHTPVKVGEHTVGRIASSRQPLETNSIANEPAVDTEWAKDQRIVSFAGYPLVAQERLAGVLVTFGRQSLSDVEFTALAEAAKPHQSRHSAMADGGGAPGKPKESGRSHRGEIDVPRQHESRDPHSDERDHRHDSPGAQDRPDAEAARLPDEGAWRGRGAFGHHQRHSRFLEDRGR